MKLTSNTLRELGSCGDYLRRFGQLFPRSEYPDGVEVNQEVCARYATDFDWAWAAETMLNWDGRQEYERLRNSRSAEAREFGTGDVKRAAIFGHLFDTQPSFRSDRVLEAARTADERADRRAARDVADCREEIEACKREVERWQRRLAEQEARLPELVELAAGAQERIAQRKAARAAEEVATAEARLQQLRAAAESAAAELAKFTEAAATPTADATADATAPAEPAASTGARDRSGDLW